MTARLATLPRSELIARLRELVRRGNAVEAELLAHLAEVDARRLYLEEGCTSMFAYCQRGAPARRRQRSGPGPGVAVPQRRRDPTAARRQAAEARCAGVGAEGAGAGSPHTTGCRRAGPAHVGEPDERATSGSCAGGPGAASDP